MGSSLNMIFIYVSYRPYTFSLRVSFQVFSCTRSDRPVRSDVGFSAGCVTQLRVFQFMELFGLGFFRLCLCLCLCTLLQLSKNILFFSQSLLLSSSASALLACLLLFYFFKHCQEAHFLISYPSLFLILQLYLHICFT